MFGRSSGTTESAAPSDQQPAEQDRRAGEQTKGRPTPSRKQAQAAAKERARASRDVRGGSKKEQRQRRSDQSRKMREAMKSGDERYLPARDKGPVKRFVRDFVDSRLCFAEFLLPLLIAIMVLGQGSGALVNVSGDLWTATFVLTIVDTGWMLWRLRKALREKFPDESTKGTTSYAVLRVLQMRFMRMPKAQVGLGGKPKR